MDGPSKVLVFEDNPEDKEEFEKMFGKGQWEKSLKPRSPEWDEIDELMGKMYKEETIKKLKEQAERQTIKKKKEQNESSKRIAS